MARVHRNYAASEYGQIHYRLAGPLAPQGGPALVCLHQSPKSGRDFHRLLAELGETRVCLAPDTPGYGQSDPPPAPPTIADYGRAVLNLMVGLQRDGIVPAGPVDLMGYHTGSAIAAWLARHHPDRVRKLVLVSLPALTAEERATYRANLHQFPVPREDASNIQALWTLTESLNDPRHGAEWRQVALADCLMSGSRLPWGFAAVFNHDHGADLDALTHQALVLCPDDDLRAQTLANARRLKHARLFDLPEARNGFLDLDTDAVAAQIAAFLDT